MSIHINGTPGHLPVGNVQSVQKNTPDSPSVSFKDVLRSTAGEREELSSGMTAGELYRASCRDCTHQGELDTLTLTDYSGLTEEERYRVIYEKYQYCFGENFLGTKAVLFPGDARDEVLTKFYEEVRANCSDPQAARRLALYGTDDEERVRQAIIGKYLCDDITYGKIFAMAGEMSECGLGSGLSLWTEEEVNRLIAESRGAEDVWDHLGYVLSCTPGENDPYTLKYQLLGEKVSPEFRSRLENFLNRG